MKYVKRIAIAAAIVGTTYGVVKTVKKKKERPVVKLYGKITDNGQVVNKMMIDYGKKNKVSGVKLDTFTVHAVASTQYLHLPKDVVSYGDYEIDRKIVKVEIKDSKVILYFDESEGATLAYLSAARNVPVRLTYTIDQKHMITMKCDDEIEQYMGVYHCDNKVYDEETEKFESVIMEDGINYQFYKASEDADTLIVWFHGNGEGDYNNSNNNIAQMLANRGTVVWASDEAQDIFEHAYVMAFQAPDTWYYAIQDHLLDKACNEIMDIVSLYDIDPKKIVVAGCSAGGYMTTRMIIAYPKLFASAMISCPALDVATKRGGQTPTDEELQSIRNSPTPIWLIQADQDDVVATEECAVRMFDALTQGEELIETTVTNELMSDYTTKETKDNKYKLTLFKTTTNDQGISMIAINEDYDQDGNDTKVEYMNHASWIYTLRNIPTDQNKTKIWQWAKEQLK